MIIAIAAGGDVLLAIAQPPGSEPAPPLATQPTGEARRDRSASAPRRGPGGTADGAAGERRAALPRNRFEMIQRRLERDLGLDDAQRVQLAALAARHGELVAEDRRTGRKIAALYRELREARQAGDQPLADRLQAQIAELEARRQADSLEGDPLGPFLEAAAGVMRGEQVDKFESIRQELLDQTRDGTALRELLRTLPEELKLDESQRARFDALATRLREQAAVEAGRGEELRKLYEDERAAREAGDVARADALQRQIEDLRPNPRRRFEKLFDELAPVLRDEQKAVLADIRETTVAGGGHTAGADDLRMMLRVVRRVELNDEQQQKLREIERVAAALERRLPRRDAAGRRTLSENVRRDLLEMMDEPQRQEFERLLNEARARLDHRRGARGG